MSAYWERVLNKVADERDTHAETLRVMLLREAASMAREARMDMQEDPPWDGDCKNHYTRAAWALILAALLGGPDA